MPSNIRCFFSSSLSLLPTVRLHYFQGRGRAECIRWMLAAAGIKFEDPAYTDPGENSQHHRPIPLA